jgi:3'-phosphoadenosine 5'-phosphosulfate sulfotransferase (PAPS reductase)/FAD synthetase
MTYERGKGEFVIVVMAGRITEDGGGLLVLWHIQSVQNVNVQVSMNEGKTLKMAKTAVSWSGGKDSTALLVRLIETSGLPDKVIFADTGSWMGVPFEFPELYEYIKRVEERFGFKTERLKLPDKTFEKWFYGKPERGENQDKVRGFPRELMPCYWSREAKINQLLKAEKGLDYIYVGIAYDERERMSDRDERVLYPLVSWRWSEQKCIDYLNEQDLFNPLYVNFDRLGCWCCPKQSEKSLYVLWKVYPHLWERFLKIEDENFKLTGRYIKADCKIEGDRSLRNYQKDFERGHIPDLPKYECWNGCQSVKKAFTTKQMRLGCMDE